MEGYLLKKKKYPPTCQSIALIKKRLPMFEEEYYVCPAVIIIRFDLHR